MEWFWSTFLKTVAYWFYFHQHDFRYVKLIQQQSEQTKIYKMRKMYITVCYKVYNIINV